MLVVACGGKTGLSLDVDGEPAVERDASVERDAAVRFDAASADCGGCDVNAQCIDGACACGPGYAGDGVVCATVIELASGLSHTCARLSDGTIRCWGTNVFGEIGSASPITFSAGVEIDGLQDVVQLGLGRFHSCARIADGSVRCWGINSRGQLGNGTLDDTSEPSTVMAIDAAVEIAVGSSLSCARHASGRVSCWGVDALGADGLLRWLPADVPALDGVAGVALGTNHHCARWPDGSVSCWGANDHRQLGEGATGPETQRSLVAVVGVANVIALGLGHSHTCALLADGRVQCWGRNDSGQLGDGTEGDDRAVPTFVSGIDSAIELAVYDDHSCVRLADWSVRCWGYSYWGEAGQRGESIWNTAPVAISGLGDAVALALGAFHSCARISDGTVRCWGGDSSGQLGNGDEPGQGATPVTVIW